MRTKAEQRNPYLLSSFWNQSGESLRLARTSIAVLFVLGLGSVFAFLVQVMLARIMGAEQFGVYTLVISWVTTLSLFLSFGLDSTILRFVATYCALRNFAALRGLLRRTMQIVAAGSMIAAVAMSVITVFLRPSISRAFLTGALVLPILTLLQLGNKILVGIQRPVYAVLSGQITRHSSLAALVLLSAYLVRIPLDAQLATFLTAVAILTALVANRSFSFAYLPKELHRVRAEYRTREWLGVGLPLMMVTGAEQVLSRGDTIILGVFRASAEVGFYGAVAALILSMNLVLTSINSVVAPQFAHLHARGDHHGTQKLLTRSSAIGFLATSPIALAFILFGHPILQIFGKSFVSGASALSLLSIGYLINALTGPVGLLLSMTGQQSLFAKAVVITASITIGFDVALIPRFGMIGAATAAMLGAIVRSTFLGTIAIVKTGIVPTAVAPVLMRLCGPPASAVAND